MKEKKLDTDTETFIGAWYINENICDDLISNYHKNEDKIREDKSGFRNYKYINNTHLDKFTLHNYVDELKEVMALYTEKYPYCKHGGEPWSLSVPFNIQMYDPGKSYNRWHCETTGPVKGKYLRHLVFMTYLNTLSDCGETEFMYQNIKVKPEKGLTLIWPAGWTHMHRGSPSMTQVKYIATGWYIFNYKIV